MTDTSLNAQEYYHFCPRCGAPLVIQEGHGLPLLACERGDYTFYQNPKTAAAAIVRNVADDIMLVERAFDPAKGAWDVPGGFVDWGEDPQDALVREMREELGVRFTPISIVCAFHGWYDFKGLRETVITLYYAGTIDGDPKPDDDVASLGWFSLDAIPENLAFEHMAKAFDVLRNQRPH